MIYYYYNESIPLFALDIYAKNRKTDLSEADKRTLKRLLPIRASGEDVPVRVTTVSVERLPAIDVRSVRQKNARFGFTAATVRNWEQGRTQPDGPARVLLAVIAHHPDAVEDALRKAS
ncbi:MAG TPA: hypothetical protein VEU96_23865 [Bryobacteraceae bacterium]|nr:hypothetical protein [Bryobacteraceae bacterium]